MSKEIFTGSQEQINNLLSGEAIIKVEDRIYGNFTMDEVVITANARGINGVGEKVKYQNISISEREEMSEQIKRSTSSENYYSPFYYDQQLQNGRLTVTLHPNAKYAGNVWVPFKSEECFKGNILKSSETNEKYLYRLKPIATAIASEDFVVSVSNSWTDFGKDNAIEGMFNSLKPYAPIIGKLTEAAGKITNENPKEGRSGGTLSGLAGQAMDFASEYGSQASNILNRQLTIQGTRFAYFSGTTTSFGNLSMKYTVFSDWIWNGDSFQFTTCYEQLEELYDYAMSKYQNIDGAIGGKLMGKMLSMIIPGTSEGQIASVTSDFLGENLKWQMPPGGFKADLKSVDNVQKGTLKLRINDMYSLENLVITSMNISFSKTPCKHPDPKYKGRIIPLYADVTLSLQPCTLYSDTALRAFTEGRSWGTVNQMKKDREKSAQKEAIKDLGNSFWEQLVKYETGEDLSTPKKEYIVYV